jgi:hypothetical protein
VLREQAAPILEEFSQLASDACAVVRIERGKRVQSRQLVAHALSLGFPAAQGLRYRCDAHTGGHGVREPFQLGGDRDLARREAGALLLAMQSA